MAGEDTVYDDFDKFEGSGGGCNIPGVYNPVGGSGDSSYVGVFFWGAYFAHNFCVSCLFSSICRHIFIPNDMEHFIPRDTLFLGGFSSFSDALEETYKLISVGFFPNVLIFGMVTDLAVFYGLNRINVEDRHGKGCNRSCPEGS